MSPFHRHEQCKVGRLGDMPGVTGELVTELRLYHAVSNLNIDKVRALAGPCEGYFMCELDWAIGFPDILSNFIFSLSWYPFPNEINICISTVSTLPSLKQTVLIQSFEDLNRTKS